MTLTLQAIQAIIKGTEAVIQELENTSKIFFEWFNGN